MSVTAQNAETVLIDRILRYKYDPLGFVRYVFPWGERGPLSDQDGPDEWQSDTLETIRTELNEGRDLRTAIQIAVASGHGIGKTACIAWIIIWFLSVFPHPQVVVTAGTKNQLETKTWRELAKWQKLAINSHWFSWTATKFFLTDSPETWYASAIPWSEHNSEAFAGTHEKHVLVIYDEASSIADIIWEVSSGAMTTPGAIWIAFGNPTKNTGRFRECFGRFRHRWITRHVDSRTAKMTNKAELQQWVDDYGEDSDYVRVRVKGQFPHAATNQFISTAIVEAAILREVEVPKGAPKIMSVDVARFGDDMTVIARRHGRKLEPLHKFRGLDTMETAATVARLIKDYRPDVTLVDGVGLGAGVVDRLKQLGYNVIEVNSANKPDPENKGLYYNKRVEMYARMREWLQGADIPNDSELRDDLIAVEYGYDARRDLMRLEKKEDMKKRGLPSPDCADAVAIGFAYNTPPVHSSAGEDPLPEWHEDI